MILADRLIELLLGVAALFQVVPEESSVPVPVLDPTNGRTISLHLRGTDVRDALRMVAQQGQVNIVMSSKVMGSISLDLEDARVTTALDAIMSVGGFQYTSDVNVITVSTLEESLERQRQQQELNRPAPVVAAPPIQAMKLFKLRYVDAERVKSLIESLLSDGGKVSLLKTNDHVAEDHGGSSGGEGGSEVQIGGRLSTTSQGQPAMSHTLVVLDVQERLDHIGMIIQEVDVRPMQVLIEARFVEIALDENLNLGIDWNVAVRASGSTAPHTFPFGHSTLGSFDPHVMGGGPPGVFPGAPPLVSTATETGLFTFGTLDFSAFSALLEMIQQDSRFQVVSNPRILVRDRRTATILVGERFPILSTTVSDQGTVTEELDHYEPIGVQLEVTPSILSDDEVELLVRPSTSTLGALVEGSTGITVARINTRQIDTGVTARDRQTVVLGGLISTRDHEVVDQIPWLGDLPLFGWLFSHESVESERVDLVVFLTVSIIRNPGMAQNDRAILEQTSLQLENGHWVTGGPDRSQLEFIPSPPHH